MQHVVTIRANGAKVFNRVNLRFALRERITVMDMDEASPMLAVDVLEIETTDEAGQLMVSDARRTGGGASLGSHDGCRITPPFDEGSVEIDKFGVVGEIPKRPLIAFGII